MGQFRDYLIEKGLYESLSKIYFKDKELEWNPNKTEKEWKQRIKQRAKISNSDFYEIIQKGIKLREKEFCYKGSTCLMFQKSQFILIIDIPTNRIVTIRDAKWDKMINDKPCQRLMVFESDEHIKDIIENVNFGLVDFDGYSYNMTGDSLILEVQHHCDCCLSVDL